MNPLAIHGINPSIRVKVTKIKGTHNATIRTNASFTGYVRDIVIPGCPMTLLHDRGLSVFRSSPVYSVSHGLEVSTVKTVHSTYTIKALPLRRKCST